VRLETEMAGAVWFKLTVTITEMIINWNKSNPLTVTEKHQ